MYIAIFNNSLFMVSPNLLKRSEEVKPLEINEKSKNLFQIIYSEQSKSGARDENIPRIRVSALISRLSFFYEKVRNAIDYDEEHLLRKNAIYRILRRQLVIEGAVKGADSRAVSEHLLIELIRGSYLPNNELPESLIDEVAAIVAKYIRLKDEVGVKLSAKWSLDGDINAAKETIQRKNAINGWIITLAACEIEEKLGPDRVKQAVVDNLFSILSKKIQLPKDLPFEDDREIQIYLSIGRQYLKLDEDMLSYVLFKYYTAGWPEMSAATEKLAVIASGLESLRQTVDRQLAHPLARQLDRIVRRYSLYYTILAETIAADPAKLYMDLQKGDKALAAAIQKICNQKYGRAKSRLWQAAVRSIIYIFLTKSVFVFLIEVPAIKFFNEPLNPVSLAINVSFPAVLLFIIVFLARKPGDDNTRMITDGIREIALEEAPEAQPIILRQPPRRTWFKDWLFNLIYGAGFLVSIYVIIRALTYIKFNWVSITIFLFFLAFVSFFSVRTTRGLKELNVVERRENIMTLLLDLFYMPIIMAGRWLSGKFSKINVFIFLFDFVIETPFKVLVEIAEDWTKYVRERRENIE